MRTFADSPVWSILKRLTLGLGLIALLSSILLVSDLAHRRTASGASGGTGTRKFKAAIVYYAQSVSNQECVNGLLDDNPQHRLLHAIAIHQALQRQRVLAAPGGRDHGFRDSHYLFLPSV